MHAPASCGVSGGPTPGLAAAESSPGQSPRNAHTPLRAACGLSRQSRSAPAYVEHVLPRQDRRRRSPTRARLRSPTSWPQCRRRPCTPSSSGTRPGASVRCLHGGSCSARPPVPSGGSTPGSACLPGPGVGFAGKGEPAGPRPLSRSFWCGGDPARGTRYGSRLAPRPPPSDAQMRVSRKAGPVNRPGWRAMRGSVSVTEGSRCAQRTWRFVWTTKLSAQRITPRRAEPYTVRKCRLKRHPDGGRRPISPPVPALGGPGASSDQSRRALRPVLADRPTSRCRTGG